MKKKKQDRMLLRVMLSLEEPSIVIRRLDKGLDGEYHWDKETVKIAKHSHAPMEKILIHELLHRNYEDKSETWVLRQEKRLWNKITRKDLAILRKAVQKARRK